MDDFLLRAVELKYQVLVDAEDDYYEIMLKGMNRLKEISEIIEVDTADVEDLGVEWDE